MALFALVDIMIFGHSKVCCDWLQFLLASSSAYGYLALAAGLLLVVVGFMVRSKPTGASEGESPDAP